MKVAFVTVALVALVAAPALASPEDVANDVSQNIMSPFCKGVTLHDCPSTAAARLRERIEGWARQGWSESRIMAELRRQYGARIDATPPTEGLGLVAWVLPAALLLLGIAAAGLLVKKWVRQPQPTGPPLSGEDRMRLEQELGTLREDLS
ncbi:MAG TPA: cytochrome c-type biogenesis protein CcmH [Actinomycetota bacterium]|nr:cytochrome c-type biogenesis protein CcmH [Actinomycetota bacterium]